MAFAVGQIVVPMHLPHYEGDAPENFRPSAKVAQNNGTDDTRMEFRNFCVRIFGKKKYSKF